MYQSKNIVSYLENTADIGTGSDQKSFSAKKKIVFIANDSPTYALRVGINVRSNQAEGIQLKSGESISDIDIIDGQVITLSFEGVGGPVAYRALGV